MSLWLQVLTCVWCRDDGKVFADFFRYELVEVISMQVT